MVTSLTVTQGIAGSTPVGTADSKYHDNDDIKRTYTPDFYMPSYDRYIEVKGYFSEKDKLKLTQVIFENKINLLLIKEYDIKNQNTLIDKIIAPVSPLSYTQ